MEGCILGDEADGAADCSGLYQLSDGILYLCATDLPYQKVEFVASDGVTERSDLEARISLTAAQPDVRRIGAVVIEALYPRLKAREFPEVLDTGT